jgi:1,4-alpha-glucan branching enzyme
VAPLLSKADKKLGANVHKNGVLFHVWAPFAESVAVTGSFNDWQPAAMEPEDTGYWKLDVKGAEAGQEYKYVINTGNGQLYKNDPHSLQVTTNAGNSVIVDTEFDWEGDVYMSTPHNQVVLYEMHIGTFNRPDPATPGTFQSASEKLDYLKELGINMIELMPITSMHMDRGWGYATDYMYAIESMYGGRRGLLEFVKEAHKRGIGVTVDVVYNHLGPQDVDLWQFDGWSQDNKGGIYFYNDWRSETPWGETRPDYGRLEVQDYILGNVTMLMNECHLDGLRLDSTIYIRNVKGHNNDPANDLPDGWKILQRLSTLAKKINPNALIIAEDSSGNDYITKPTDIGGAGFSAQWELNLPHVLRELLAAPEDASRNLTYLVNLLSNRYNDAAFERVVYADSHDSAANGSQRLNEQISPKQPASLYARKRSLQAAGLVLTIPGIPMLFQGQEFMQGGEFNDWEGLDWEAGKSHLGIAQAYRDLINLRRNKYKNTGGLSAQCFSILHLNEESKVLAYHRWENGGPGDDVLVVFNFSNNTLKDYGINFPLDGSWHIRFNSGFKGYSSDFKELDSPEIREVQNGFGTVSIAPYSMIVLSQDA